MRVVHVISGLDPRSGGTTSALVGLATSQAQAGLQVSVVATFRAGAEQSPVSQLERSGVSVTTIGPCVGPTMWHREIRPLMDKALVGADIVHIHTLWEEVQHQAARAAQRRGIPYVISPHGMLDPWSLGQSRWKKRFYMAWRLRRNLQRAAAIHFTTQAECDLTRPLRLCAPPIVEGLGVDLSEFESLPAPGTFRSRWPMLGERTIVLFMSRLHPKKGLDLLIPAFARCRASNAVLVLAGPADDAYRATVEQMVRQHGLEDKVLLTGMLFGADRVAALADARIFVLPSYQENFGVVVIEALAAGVPVIISDQVNLHPAITAGGVGAVVPTRTEAVQAEIDRWLADESLWTAAAQKARPFVWENYDWTRIGQRWVGHYQRTLKNG